MLAYAQRCWWILLMGWKLWMAAVAVSRTAVPVSVGLPWVAAAIAVLSL